MFIDIYNFDNFFYYYFFLDLCFMCYSKCVYNLDNPVCLNFFVYSIYSIIILLDYADFIFYKNFKSTKKKKDDLSIIERWVFAGLFISYWYIKYYVWYDYFFNYTRRQKRRKNRRKKEKKKKEVDQDQINLLKKPAVLTKHQYYDLYMCGFLIGVGTVSIVLSVCGYL